MQVNLTCPGCGLIQTVDPAGLPAGATFRCGQCPTVFRVNANGEIEASVGAKPTPAPSVPRPAGASVACPSCGHHFAIVLPQAPSPVTVGAAAPPALGARPTQQLVPPPAGGSLAVTLPTILVVEDTAFFRELVKDTLAGSYRVLLCSSKAEALHLIETEPLDLLLLDLSLDEDVDGREVLREMGPKRFHILVFTARDESDLYGEVWQELQQLGVDDMLIKGMNVADHLLSKIEELLGAAR